MVSEGSRNSAHILIVDDEAPICDLVKHILQTLRPGYNVMTVMDGKATLARLEQHIFDLVITDYQLPGMNGLEIAHCIGKRWPDIPIILISGKPPPNIREQVKALGLAGFLRKPFSPAQLVEMVEIALAG
jgi:CheY-like chemotaxis protein